MSWLICVMLLFLLVWCKDCKLSKVIVDNVINIVIVNKVIFVFKVNFDNIVSFFYYFFLLFLLCLYYFIK